MGRNPEVGKYSVEDAFLELRDAVDLAKIRSQSEKAASRLERRQPLPCFSYRRFVAIDRYDRYSRGEQRFAVAASAQRAIQHLLRHFEQPHDLFDHDRRMVGAIPPAGHGRRVGHLQKRFTSLSTAGVNCGIAVMS